MKRQKAQQKQQTNQQEEEKKPAYIAAGKRLTELREHKNHPQAEIDVEARIGNGNMSRYENAVRKPKRSTLIRILDCLDAMYSERKEIMDLYGYTTPAIRPTPDEIKSVIDLSRETIENFIFPAYLLDCVHKLHFINTKVHNIIGKPHNEALQYIGYSMIDIVYDRERGVGKFVDNPDDFYHSFAKILRHEMGDYGDTEWYLSMMNEYLAKYPIFAKHWKVFEDSKVPCPPSRPTTKIILDLPKYDLVSFYVFSEQIIRDTRFRIVHYLPADPKTMQIAYSWQENSF